MKFLILFAVLTSTSSVWAKTCRFTRAYHSNGERVVKSLVTSRCTGEQEKKHWVEGSGDDLIPQFENENGVSLTRCEGGGSFRLPNGLLVIFHTCHFAD